MVNMNDVAKKAGVARGTVSNYINNVKIKESSRIKVEAAIRELNYVPNVAARELKMSKSSTVVFILPTVWNPFFGELTYHLQLALKEKGWKMLLCNSQDDYRLEVEYIEMANQNKVVGIISISYSDISPYLKDGIPYVAIERFYNENIPFVTSDNFGGGALAAKTLAEKGARKLLHITRDVPGNHALANRSSGFSAYCQEKGLDFEILQKPIPSKEFHDFVADFLTEQYKSGNQYEGIFCGTDRYASYCLDALAELNLSVPEDVQVIGFDGSKSYVNEQLKISTIRQPVEALAQQAVNLLETIFNENCPEKQLILPVTFEEYQTTKKM